MFQHLNGPKSKCRLRSLLLERLEDRLCLSTWSDPVNLGPIINGAGFDNRRPAISADGLSIYFSSNRPGGPADTGPLWVSHRASVDDAWGEPQQLGPAINDPSATSSSAPYFSTDQHWLFFHSDRTDLVNYGAADIYAAYRPNTNDDFGWQTPINLGPGINTQYDDAGPAYFEDPATGITTLYFNSDRPGGPGDYDIYATTLQGFARFGPAVLVPELDSPNRDTRMAIRSDGLEMLLTSNRPGGLGSGLNIWVATRASTLDPWSTPENLGAPINMEGFNDGAPALSPDGNTMYFYSNRPGGYGVNDLWMSTRQGGGQAPRAPLHRFAGLEPGVVQVIGFFSGPDDQRTIRRGNSAPAEPTRDNQAAALHTPVPGPVSNTSQRKATDSLFASRPSADGAQETLRWSMVSELYMPAFDGLSDL